MRCIIDTPLEPSRYGLLRDIICLDLLYTITIHIHKTKSTSRGWSRPVPSGSCLLGSGRDPFLFLSQMTGTESGSAT
jgi:hypothetical protein